MKKIIAIALAAAMVATLGVGYVFASSNSSNGVPSSKTAVGSADVDFTPVSGGWVTDNVIGPITIKTSNASSLIISFTAEAALCTDVSLNGSTGSTSAAGLQVQVLVDGSPLAVSPNDVTLDYRLMTLSGNLWESTTSNTTSANFTGLPDQYIDIYEETRSANGFNFVAQNVGVGVHTITIQYYVPADETGVTNKKSNPGEAGVVVGKRTCVVEVDRLTN